MKSMTTPPSTIALTIEMISDGWPIHNLIPTGLPPDKSRSFAAKASNSLGVENSLCLDGEITSW